MENEGRGGEEEHKRKVQMLSHDVFVDSETANGLGNEFFGRSDYSAERTTG